MQIVKLFADDNLIFPNLYGGYFGVFYPIFKRWVCEVSGAIIFHGFAIFSICDAVLIIGGYFC